MGNWPYPLLTIVTPQVKLADGHQTVSTAWVSPAVESVQF